MKTKILSPLRRDGYKAGMIMMLIALSTMLLTTACSNDDDLANNTANTETVANKGYALPVTVNVTRGGDATTRATFDGSKLNFSDGDKLFVRGGSSSEGSFAGTLTWQSGGTFSGTIYTSHEWTGTADAHFAAAIEDKGYITATLLPNGYNSYGYLSIYNHNTYDDYVTTNDTYTLATSKAAGVEQFSYEKATTYSSGFALAPQNAILNFAITGLAASTNVAVSLTGSGYTITKTVTTDGSGTATFAAGVEANTDLNDLSLTVGGNAITLVNESKTLTAGKIYNITRAAAPAPAAATGHALSSAVVGNIICSDGLAYTGTDYDNLPTGVTARAKVCYVSGGHGLALALADEGKMYWSTAISTCEGKTPTITGCTWKLATMDEWNNMKNVADFATLRDGFVSVGGSNMLKGTYWSSTEDGTDNAWNCNFGNMGGGAWFSSIKNSNNYNVRACLAF